MKQLTFLLLSLALCASAATFTGADKFWRPRQNLIFFLLDEKGGGFELALYKRDMNVYLEGKRDAYAFVIAPNGRIVARQFMKDDGIVKNDYTYKDGIWDEGMDFRYRAFTGRNTPDGLAEGKKRSPLLEHPEQIKADKYVLQVPDCGTGIYRVVLSSCWDHWFSLDPSRKMSCGIHSGAGPLYLHGKQMEEAYMYISEACRDLYIATSEEVKPYNWSVTTMIQGIIGQCSAGKGFFNYMVWKNVPKKTVMKLCIQGTSTGACLHVKGNPTIFWEDEATARKVANNISEPALAVVRKYAALQPDNKSLKRLSTFGLTLGFSDYDWIGRDFKRENSNEGFRSSWWNFGDGRFNPKELPQDQELKEALTNIFEKWALYRYMMETGATVNQWAKILYSMGTMYKYCESPLIMESLRYNIARMCTQYSLGRLNPLKDDWKSGYEPDNGFIDNGIMAECLGHDCEYNLETDADMSILYDLTGMKEILAYQEKYYRLKTHLTASKTGTATTNTFIDTFSETASNARTRFYTHKAGAKTNLIHYGDLWGGKDNKEKTQWPHMEEKPFVRNLDDRYHAVQTGKAYMLFYTGPSDFIWNCWSQWKYDGCSAYIDGVREAGYGGWQWYCNKSGGLGFIWIRDFGPSLVASNHNLMYTNDVWGETQQPFATSNSLGVNPYTTSEVISPKCGSFDAKARHFTRSGIIPRTPLRFKREIQVLDTGVAETVTLEATEDCTLKSLYEAIPFSVGNRDIIVNGNAIPLEKPLMTPTHYTIKEAEGFTQGTRHFETDQIRVKNRKNGKVVLISLDKKYQVLMPTTFKYRDISLEMSGFNLELPRIWEKGDNLTIKYTVALE